MSRHLGIGIILGAIIGIILGVTILAPKLKTHAASKAVLSERDLASTTVAKTAPTLPALNDSDAIHWRSASPYPSDRPGVLNSARALSKKLAVVSNDKIILPTVASKEVISAERVFGPLASGRIDALIATADIGVYLEPALALFGGVPFGPPPADMVAWMQAGNGTKFMQELFERHNIHAMVCGFLPAQSGGWFRNEITSTDQLEGLRLKADGLGAKVWQKVGAEIRQVNDDAMMSAFDQNELDGAIFSNPSDDAKTGLSQFAKNYYFPAWQNQGQPLLLLLNTDAWKALGQSDRELIKATCDQQTLRNHVRSAKAQFDGIKALTQQKVTIRRYPTYLMETFREAWKEVLAEEIRQNQSMLRIWEDMNAYSDARKSWGQLGYGVNNLLRP